LRSVPSVSSVELSIRGRRVPSAAMSTFNPCS
jgi:hypothetical protein